MNKLHNLRKTWKLQKNLQHLASSLTQIKVKSEITALTNTLNQFAGAINTGTVDPEVEVPKMLEKLKSEGAYQKCLTKCKKTIRRIPCF